MGLNIKCVPVLERAICCCCSCTLRTASLVIGWLEMVCYILLFVNAVLNLVFLDPSQPPKQEAPFKTMPFAIGALVSHVVAILVIGLLLFGVHKERPSFILVYLILCLIGICLTILAMVILTIITIIAHVVVGLVVLVFFGLIIALECYFWVVIYSYYRQLETRNEPRPIAHMDNFVAVKQNEPEPRPYYEFPHHNQPGQQTA
ncbi:lysosomal-associated transmembrane protein 4B-like [Periplaneta americana]|uniref:lysosomal-associated transmembrane protein 4B-like n=1 Tax=Periplaneta americana TaxID=6978 RepID=UPI0037E7F08D